VDRLDCVAGPFDGASEPSTVISFHRCLIRYQRLSGVLRLDDGTGIDVVVHGLFLDVIADDDDG